MLSIGNTAEIASTTGSGHLPGERVRTHGIDTFVHSGLYHGREHCDLSLEGILICTCEFFKIPLHYRVPATRGGIGESSYFLGCDIPTFNN